MRTFYRYVAIFAVEVVAFFTVLGILLFLTQLDGVDMMVIALFASFFISLTVYFKYFDNEGEFCNGKNHK